MDTKRVIACPEEGCYYATYFDFALKTHLKSHHNQNHKKPFSCFQMLESDSLEQSSCYYECLKCNFKSSTLLFLTRHKVQSGCNKKLMVMCCPSPYTQRRRIIYKCVLCSFTVYGRQKLYSHLVRNHKCRDLKHRRSTYDYKKTRQIFKCDYCKFKTLVPAVIKNHLILKHTSANGIKLYQCDLCDYRTRVKMHIGRHKIYRHTKPEDVIWHYCKMCDFKAREIYEINRHRTKVHPLSNTIYYCNQCSFRGLSERSVKRHITSQHLVAQDKYSTHVYINCAHCTYKTNSEYKLRSHVRKQHGCLSRCVECRRNFTVRRGYKVHPAKRIFKCVQCGFNGFSDMHLANHILNQHFL